MNKDHASFIADKHKLYTIKKAPLTFKERFFFDHLLKMVKNCSIANKRLFLCIMLKNRFLLAAIALVFTFTACQKQDVYDREAQLQTDREIILKFIADQKLTNVLENDGVFYQVIKEGTGTEPVELTDLVSVFYEGRLIKDGTVFETSTDTVKFTLNEVIEGWQKGIPAIKKGGEIRLLIPSPMAYANFEVGPIPANSPLDFTVELLDVVKQTNK